MFKYYIYIIVLNVFICKGQIWKDISPVSGNFNQLIAYKSVLFTNYTQSNNTNWFSVFDGENWLLKTDVGLTKFSPMYYYVYKNSLWGSTGYTNGMYRWNETEKKWIQQNGFGGYAIYAMYADDKYFWLGTDKGILKIDENGTYHINTSDPFRNQFVTKIIHINNDFFVSAGNKIYTSQNDGSSWIDLQIPTNKDTYYKTVEVYNNEVFVGTTSDGIFKYSPNTTTWKSCNNGLPINECTGFTIHNGILYTVISGKGVYQLDSVCTWKQLKSQPWMYDVCSIGIADSSLIFGTYINGIYISSSNGSTWKQINSGLKNIGVERAIKQDNTMYYLTDFPGLSWYDDVDSCWKRTPAINIPMYRALKILGAAISDSSIIVCTDRKTIHSYKKSLNQWENADIGLVWGSSNTDVINNVMYHNGTFLLNARGNIFRSTNSGKSWLPSLYPISYPATTPYSNTSDNISYISSNNIYRSRNLGVTWDSSTITFSRYDNFLPIRVNNKTILPTDRLVRITDDDFITYTNFGINYESDPEVSAFDCTTNMYSTLFVNKLVKVNKYKLSIGVGAVGSWKTSNIDLPASGAFTDTKVNNHSLYVMGDGGLYSIATDSLVNLTSVELLSDRGLNTFRFSFEIKPQPANDYIQISINSEPMNLRGNEELKLYVYDVLGKQVFTLNTTYKSTIELPVSQFSDGVYYLKIMVTENTCMIPFVIVH